MSRRISLKPQSIDRALLASVAFLASLGIVLVYSSSAVYAATKHDNASFYLFRHLVGWCVALGSAFVLAQMNIETLRRRSGWFFLGLTFLVMLTFVPGLGATAGGAQRWLSLFGLRFQPGEWVKLGVVIVMASALALREEKGREGIDSLLPAFFFVQIPILGVLLGRDFGSAVVLEAIVVAMLFAAGLRFRTLFLFVLMAMPIAYYFIFSESFRLRRLVAYIDPWAYRSTFGYQVTEALISMGSGGVLGVGLGDSKHKLFFLPEAHTDFPFAILTEELGLLGASAVLFAFALLFYRGAVVAVRARDAFSRYLALGCLLIIGIPAVFNLCVATGLLPTKGLPLPLLSYGRSNLMVVVAALVLLLKVSSMATDPRDEANT